MNHNSLRWQGTLILGLFAALMLLSLPCKSGDVENGSQRVLLEIGQEKITVEDFFLYKTPEKAGQAEARLRQGAAFDELAKDKKADSDVLLVEHGWFTPSLLIPELSEIAFQLPVGGTSNVLRSSYGYHVLRAEAQEPSRVKDFAEARPEILDKVRQTKAAKLYGEILDNTRNSQQVRLYLDRLQR